MGRFSEIANAANAAHEEAKRRKAEASAAALASRQAALAAEVGLLTASVLPVLHQAASELIDQGIFLRIDTRFDQDVTIVFSKPDIRVSMQLADQRDGRLGRTIEICWVQGDLFRADYNKNSLATAHTPGIDDLVAKVVEHLARSYYTDSPLRRR
jgi:hypothetical protein